MTIIAYKDRIMAADSCSFSGANGRRYPATRPKIVSGPLGLFAAAGLDSDAMLAKIWFMAGMSDVHPELSTDKDEPLNVLWAKPDGSVWFADHRLVFIPTPPPTSIGAPSAVNFTEGAMCAGLSAPAAVALAIERCVWGGGEVQVARLHAGEPGGIINVRHGETFDQARERARGGRYWKNRPLDDGRIAPRVFCSWLFRGSRML